MSVSTIVVGGAIHAGPIVGIAMALRAALRTLSRPRWHAQTAVIALLTCVLACFRPAQADEPLTLVLHNHRFEPPRIEVPANVKFQLQVKNTDNTADEFESVELNREKLVAPGQTITVFLGPLSPGEYKFFGDFHQDTAQGVMVAK